MPTTVEVTGEFLVESSLARVNRGLFGALARRSEVDLGILPEPTAAPIVGNSDDVLLQARRTRRFVPEPQIMIRHRWPAVFPKVRSGAYVHMQPWEFGSLPKVWAEGAKAVADEIWCYSKYIAEMYVRAGIERERVQVVPLGYDPEIFKPGPAPLSATLRGRIAFLYVGDTIARKGVDVVVNAYLAAFSPHDNVVLIVKDFGGKDPGADTRLRDHVASLGGRRDIPPVLYIDTFYTDNALADLYRAATALVAPYRGEGFGLPILEAMACGVPSIATRGGASDDFTTKDTTLHIDASPVKLGKSYGGFELVDDAFLLEPVEQQVIAAMRQVYENPKLVKFMSEKSADHARSWTWERGAERALERIEALAKITSRAKTRNDGPSGTETFELRIASRGGEDGVLLELFRRLGVEDPSYIECVANGESQSISVFFSRSLGWRGAVIECDTATYADFAAKLSSVGPPTDFELLALGSYSDPAWSRLVPFKPKVIVTPGNNPPKALASSTGYTCIGIESKGTSAFFVRNDLALRSRFNPKN
ncbi:MAG TPA: glycosyltransferase [Candidatus Baltobacteraceae bacterium]|jgi:glycosyltransferase involved in cell wall biosynthesis